MRGKGLGRVKSGRFSIGQWYSPSEQRFSQRGKRMLQPVAGPEEEDQKGSDDDDDEEEEEDEEDEDEDKEEEELCGPGPSDEEEELPGPGPSDDDEFDDDDELPGGNVDDEEVPLCVVELKSLDEGPVESLRLVL